jgi:hypothetical protein
MIGMSEEFENMSKNDNRNQPMNADCALGKC